jgi:hypothetical protein
LRVLRRPPRRWGIVPLLWPVLLLVAQSVLPLVSLAADVDVEPFDTDALFGQSVAERGQVIEEQPPGGRRLGFKIGRQHAVVHGQFDSQRAELGRAEAEAQRSASFLRELERARHAADKASRFHAIQIGRATWVWF